MEQARIFHGLNKQETKIRLKTTAVDEPALIGTPGFTTTQLAYSENHAPLVLSSPNEMSKKSSLRWCLFLRRGTTIDNEVICRGRPRRRKPEDRS